MVSTTHVYYIIWYCIDYFISITL